MAYEQKDGDIAVFKNDKNGNDKSPDWKGNALINGVKMEVAFWQKSDTMLAGQIKDKWKPSQNDKDKQNAYVKDHQAPLEEQEIPF